MDQQAAWIGFVSGEGGVLADLSDSVMRVIVSFYSYFRTLADCSSVSQDLPEGASIADLVAAMGQRFPRLASMDKSMLVAVGVDYRSRDHVLQDGDEVSLFPPVQGG